MAAVSPRAAAAPAPRRKRTSTDRVRGAAKTNGSSTASRRSESLSSEEEVRRAGAQAAAVWAGWRGCGEALAGSGAPARGGVHVTGVRARACVRVVQFFDAQPFPDGQGGAAGEGGGGGSEGDGGGSAAGAAPPPVLPRSGDAPAVEAGAVAGSGAGREGGDGGTHIPMGSGGGGAGGGAGEGRGGDAARAAGGDAPPRAAGGPGDGPRGDAASTPGAGGGAAMTIVDKDTGRVYTVSEIDYDAFTTFAKDNFLGVKVGGARGAVLGRALSGMCVCVCGGGGGGGRHACRGCRPRGRARRGARRRRAAAAGVAFFAASSGESGTTSSTTGVPRWVAPSARALPALAAQTGRRE